MFVHSAAFYDALYGFKDYGAAVARLQPSSSAKPWTRRTYSMSGAAPAATWSCYDVQGLDVNGAILEVARARTPGVSLSRGRCGRLLARRPLRRRHLSVFSSIKYVRTLGRIRSAVAAMPAPLRGGRATAVAKNVHGRSRHDDDRVQQPQVVALHDACAARADLHNLETGSMRGSG